MVDRKRKDFIENSSENREIQLPIAHYTLINHNNKESNIIQKIAIYGLGSCIALFLYDKENKIYGMSHILLPESKLAKTKGPLKYPHKFVDSSIRDLISELLKHGAEKENFRAVIAGGAWIFQDHFNNIGQNNIKAVKKELKNLNIKIEKEDTGGKFGRVILFDPVDNSVNVKLTGEKTFRKLL